MRTPPTEPYSGLTVILDAPSRFDLDQNRLLSATGGEWFGEECLVVPYRCGNIDTRCLQDRSPLLPGTKFILLLGSKHDGIPGYPYIRNGVPCTIAYHPQDCNDHRNFSGDDDADEEQTTERDTKDEAPTRRKNYRFWTKWFTRKLIGACPFIQTGPRLEARVYPRLDEVIKVLRATTGQDLYIDIETSRIHRSLNCIGFSTSQLWPKVYVVPIYDYMGRLAYSDITEFHRELSLAFTRNTVVAHNGSGFDFFVLHAWYKFPLPTTPYDTMLANHRCFPEIEKSLAHLIAQWTILPYHKGENLEPRNPQQQEQLWLYNAKDVYALKLIKDAQLLYASSVTGLLPSIQQANASIIPYLTTTLNGLRLDQLKLANKSRTLLRDKALYERMASILVGKPFNPGSTKQCADFFHRDLHYPVVSRTGTGAPALGSKQLYQLQLKHNNPLIPVIIKYRLAAKDASMLESELWTMP